MEHDLALKIKDLINKNNLSVQGLEKKAGLKINAVRNILSGQSKNPQAKTLLAVSKALDCSISDLLEEDLPFKKDKKSVDEIEFENFDLLEKILIYIITFHKTRSASLTTRQLMKGAQEIYLYCLKHNKGVFEKNFSEWFLEKEINSF